MTESEKSGKTIKKSQNNSGGGAAFYGLGLIGAFVFYFQQADTFWLYAAAILKALVWPAFVVYDLLKFLHG